MDALPTQPAPKKKPPKYISETDPDAAWSLKDSPGRFSYETNYLIDTDHGIIMDVEATPARAVVTGNCRGQSHAGAQRRAA